MSWISQLYDWGNSVHRELYQRKLLKPVRLSCPVISVGNLTMGGTGKTPVVDRVVKFFLNKKMKVGIVSRSYKAQSRAPTKVERLRPGAGAFYGDEAVLLAERNPEAIVYVGSSKSKVAQVLIQNEKVDIIIVDDGFQHYRLCRDMDVVLVDVSQKPQHYQVFPSGQARENFAHVSRADFILLTKYQAACPETLQMFQDQCTSKAVALTTQKLGVWKNLTGIENRGQPEGKWLAVCGIADPVSFHRLLQNQFSQCEFILKAFPDHYQYTESTLKLLYQEMERLGAQGIVVTEKDAVKIRDLRGVSEKIFLIPLELVFQSHESEFYESLARIII